MTSSISFMGQSISQINRLKSTTALFTDLQRQLTSQKKFDTFSGLGTDSGNVQRYRANIDHVNSYVANIDTVTTRMNMMNESLTRIGDLGRQLVSQLGAAQQDGQVDINTIKTLANDSLSFLRTLVNTNIDGRYLFAGANSQTMPLPDVNGIKSQFQTEMTNWLSGAQTTNQLLTNANAFSATALGLDPALSSASPVSIRVDDGQELDYTILANDPGFQDIIRALSFAANLKVPDPATDVPTSSDFRAVMDGVMSIASRGVAAMDSLQTKLGSKFQLIQGLRENHTQDLNTFQKFVDTKENADTTEVVAKLQALQTQLTASYQVTNMASQLSLVNYLTG